MSTAQSSLVRGSTAEKNPAPLAMASLVLGILGLLTSWLGVGLLLALAGLILGWVHLRRREHARRIGGWGVGLSAVGVVVSAVVLFYVISTARMMSREAQRVRLTGFEAWYGKAMPDLSVGTLDGNSVSLAELRGRRVVLQFWASWEPKCVRMVPHLVRLAKEAPSDDLAIVAISGEDAGALNSFAGENGVNYLVGCSGRRGLPEPYSMVKMLPTTLYIDREGILRHVSVGYRNYESVRDHASDAGLKPPAPGMGRGVPDDPQ